MTFERFITKKIRLNNGDSYTFEDIYLEFDSDGEVLKCDLYSHATDDWIPLDLTDQNIPINFVKRIESFVDEEIFQLRCEGIIKEEYHAI